MPVTVLSCVSTNSTFEIELPHMRCRALSICQTVCGCPTISADNVVKTTFISTVLLRCTSSNVTRCCSNVIEDDVADDGGVLVVVEVVARGVAVLSDCRRARNVLVVVFGVGVGDVGVAIDARRDAKPIVAVVFGVASRFWLTI